MAGDAAMIPWLTRRRLRALDALVTGTQEQDWRMGLTFSLLRRSEHPWALVWRVGGGFGWWWCPPGILRFILLGWNAVVCRISGHDILDEGRYSRYPTGAGRVCLNCSKTWPHGD